jgi:hypothetical protein
MNHIIWKNAIIKAVSCVIGGQDNRNIKKMEAAQETRTHKKL